MLTSALYHAIRNQYGSNIGILCSSSITDNYGINIALPKEVVDREYLRLNHVVMYKCERTPSNHKDYKVFPCCKGADTNAKGDFKLLGIC